MSKFPTAWEFLHQLVHMVLELLDGGLHWTLTSLSSESSSIVSCPSFHLLSQLSTALGLSPPTRSHGPRAWSHGLHWTSDSGSDLLHVTIFLWWNSFLSTVFLDSSILVFLFFRIVNLIHKAFHGIFMSFDTTRLAAIWVGSLFYYFFYYYSSLLF